MMKPFDKRSVPGLEDCSSESDCDNEVINKKLRHDDDIEIEIEVKNNEFLKEEPVLDDKLVQKRSNSIWGNVVQDEMLNESLQKIGVNKLNVKRSVESYTVSEESRHNKRRHHNKTNYKTNGLPQKQNRKLPVKERIVQRTFDKTKIRNLNLNPKIHSTSEIIHEIARILNEPKQELIGKCYNVLGFDKCLEFLYMTLDIEENGGLLVLDGSRRRSPGGVFLNLIKESKNLREEDIRKIFMFNAIRKNGGPHNGGNHRSKTDNRSLINIELVKPSQPPSEVMEVSETSQPVTSKDEELEDGEIP